ncbi:DHH family phosphoesterase [Pseudonocardia endophytica]|uniref:Phosphoesterase RecJ-like protein n=1 Tax=Pseudonocardia endophytica TaxID=401976 RepID=A0A4R1HRV3_PSEEN|nr:DHH family phosphoesterase [Pseudonocardia endophytica]TCK25354.1 phosphoesterase RecJ-like protein [Pseudonocardia endophytica]
MRPDPGAVDAGGAAALLRDASDVLVLGHVGPDPDTLGCAVSVATAMRRRGVPAVVAVGDPGPIADRLRTLDPDGIVVHAADAPPSPDLLVCCDASERRRLGSLADRLDTAGASLVIDHHVSFVPFGTHQFVDPTAPATVTLVRQVLAELGEPLDANQASALFAGLYTDTGGLRAGGAPTLRLAAELVEAGAEPASLMRGLNGDRPFGWLAALATILAGAHREPDAVAGAGLVWARVDAATAGRFGEQVGSVMGQLAATAGHGVAALLTECQDGTWSVSLRGTGRPDLSAVARRLGGGGHRGAAGAELGGTADGVLEALREALVAETVGQGT